MIPTSVKNIPLLDLRAQFEPIRDEILAATTSLIDSQKFIMGDEVKKLEQEIAAYSNTRSAIGCASGSDALFLALLAAGVGRGDAVLTTPFTFFATVGSIVRIGARPVFVDVQPDTYNMDVTQVEKALDANPDVKAIIPVHLFGACADMDPLMEIAGARGVTVIEDAAQSIGSEYKGRRAGSIGHIGCFSFFPSKNLGAFGDGGMVTTNDADLASRLAALRVHGSKKKYYHEMVGINSRLDALQAAILRVKFRYLDSWTAGRQRNADIYRRKIAADSIPVTPPAIAPHTTRHVYNQFSILADRRDELQAHLKANGVGTEVYYPLTMHLQPCFAELGHREGDFPVSERLAKQALALPIYAELPAGDIDYVCETIAAFYRR